MTEPAEFRKQLYRIRLPEDPEALRLLEAREEAEEGGEPACLLGRLCPACENPVERADRRTCPNCGADLARPAPWQDPEDSERR
jgi:hypothetical protein